MEAHTIANMLYHFGPPIVVGLLVFWLGRRVKGMDDARQSGLAEMEAYRAEVRSLLRTIQRQNDYFIRKLIELITTHNEKHPSSRVELGEYPTSFEASGGD